jgi:site-specific DNA-cytosine methylase
MKVLYLAAGYAVLKYNNVVYQDKFIKRDIGGDMMDVDLSIYDILIASPPCNYYSKANYRRNVSKYSLSTKHLLPDIIDKFVKTNKPFIVENVINKNLMKDIINNCGCFYFELGRHCYFTNIMIDISCVNQINDNIQNISKNKRQGGYNVNAVFDYFIQYILLERS